MANEEKQLVERLRHLVSLNEPRHGGPYQGAAAEACVTAMAEAASTIERLSAIEQERDALREIVDGFLTYGVNSWDATKHLDIVKRARTALNQTRPDASEATDGH